MYRAPPSESVRYDDASGTLSLFALITLRLRLIEVEVQLIKERGTAPFLMMELLIVKTLQKAADENAPNCPGLPVSRCIWSTLWWSFPTST